jgi:LmbE family N-acetylglucosaminyl deacetylase
VAVVSPHLDDAVLSCGGLMSDMREPVVITVFAGSPPDWGGLTGWDEACGFEPGSDVVAARVAEDDAALSCLRAQGLRLAFLDEQYRDPSARLTADRIGEEILSAVRRAGAETVFIPVGLVHADHLLCAAAARWAASRAPELQWFAYEDLPYAYEGADSADSLSLLEEMHPAPVKFPPPSDPSGKGRVIDCYASQMAAFGRERRALALRAERYWRLTTSATDPRSG